MTPVLSLLCMVYVAVYTLSPLLPEAMDAALFAMVIDGVCNGSPFDDVTLMVITSLTFARVPPLLLFEVIVTEAIVGIDSS